MFTGHDRDGRKLYSIGLSLRNLRRGLGVRALLAKNPFLAYNRM